MYKISSWDINNEIIWKMKTFLGKRTEKVEQSVFWLFLLFFFLKHHVFSCAWLFKFYFISAILKYLTPELHWEIAFPFLTGPGDMQWNSTRQSYLQTTTQQTGNTNNTWETAAHRFSAHSARRLKCSTVNLSAFLVEWSHSGFLVFVKHFMLV